MSDVEVIEKPVKKTTTRKAKANVKRTSKKNVSEKETPTRSAKAAKIAKTAAKTNTTANSGKTKTKPKTPRKTSAKPKTKVRKPKVSKAVGRKKKVVVNKETDQDVIEKVSSKNKTVSAALEEALGGQTKSEDKLEKVRSKAEHTVKLQRWIDKAEALLKERKKDLNEMVTKVLPVDMVSINLEGFKLSDGTEILVEKKVKGSLPKDDQKRNDAVQYLYELEADGILKPEINVLLVKGQDKQAKKTLAKIEKVLAVKKKRKALLDTGLFDEEDVDMIEFISRSALVSQNCAWQTLCALGREFNEQGEDIDFKRLGLWSGDIAKINLSEEKAGLL
jgi:hypothetical protein